MGSIYQKFASSFDIKIIGAGIAGLATALALDRVDEKHKITVYKSAATLSEAGAGIQLKANATRLLYHWGVQDKLAQVAAEPKITTFRRYDDDSVLGEVPSNPVSAWEYDEFPHWLVCRPDLQRLLAAACKRHEVEIVLGGGISRVDPLSGTL